MTIKIISAFLFPAFCFSGLFAQVEYLVQINPTTCDYAISDSIRGVKLIEVSSATFDKINNSYVFRGEDQQSNWYLYSIDATSGRLISNPQFTGKFGAMKFDNATGIFYGIHWTTSLSNAEFVSINPANMHYSVIRAINLSSLINSEPSFDDSNHRFMFAAGDSIGKVCFYSVDVATGKIISKPAIGNVAGLQYDNSSGNLYGLRWNNSLQLEDFVLVNITNGNIQSINSIPSVSSVDMGYATFDEINKRYTFRGADGKGVYYLFTLDAANGKVVSNTLFPVLPNPYNIIETRYNNSNGKLYALHWGSFETTGIKNNEDITTYIFPNPFSTRTVLQTDRTLTDAMLTVYDLSGQSVKQIKKISGHTVTLLRDNLSCGLYFLSLAEGDKIIYTGKLVIIN